jgi:hypothetical protein
MQRYAAGKFHRVPVLVGTNQNETLTFAMDITSPLHNQASTTTLARST